MTDKIKSDLEMAIDHLINTQKLRLRADEALREAAPDLLAALKGALKSFKCTQRPEHYPADHWCRRAIEAISKAERGNGHDG